MTHDPGGKIRMRLQDGVIGRADFIGANQEHRLALERYWGNLLEPDPDPRYALWIGMNPSTASHDVDDLTVRKEQTWTRMLGLVRYIKCNIGSYRSTNPAGLAQAEVVSHPDNLPTILRLATAPQAHRVILTTGAPPPVLECFYRATVQALRGAGVPLWCLGKTKGGWPKHSSRIGYHTPIVEFTD